MRTTRIFRETILRLDQVPKQIAGVASLSAVRSWIEKGLLVRDGPYQGRKVTLEHASIGGAPCTSEEAVYRFLGAINGEQNVLTEEFFGACEKSERRLALGSTRQGLPDEGPG